MFPMGTTSGLSGVLPSHVAGMSSLEITKMFIYSLVEGITFSERAANNVRGRILGLFRSAVGPGTFGAKGFVGGVIAKRCYTSIAVRLQRLCRFFATNSVRFFLTHAQLWTMLLNGGEIRPISPPARLVTVSIFKLCTIYRVSPPGKLA
jgi:hypothetical protein